MKAPFYESQRFRWGVGLLALAGVMTFLWWGSLVDFFLPLTGQAPFTGRFLAPILSFGFALFSVGLTRNLFSRLVSQFTLPVISLEERRQAMDHLDRYSSGRLKKAVSIHDGRLEGSADEMGNVDLAGGVLLVDSASGVVLRTDTHLTRAHGPGVVFIRPGEYIAEVLDLRKQSRRAEKVKALTRDGIELMVDLGVTFMLDTGEPQPYRNVPDPNLPPYVFREDNALKVGYGRSYRDKMLGEWAELPSLLAADLWRESLIQRDFESLFSSSDAGLPLLEGLRFQIQSRLTGAGLEEMPREARLLSERGLRVLNVSLSNLSMPEEVQRKRLEAWKEDWKSQAGEIPDDKDPVIKKWRQAGQKEARLHLLSELTRYVREQLEHGQSPAAVDVALNLTAATRHLLNDPSLQNQQNVADLRTQIETLEIWAQRQATAFRNPASR